MTMNLRKATRQQAKLRIGVTAPSGAGKTYSSLLIAQGLASSWDKIALIDTENRSGDLYSHLGEYNIITLDAPYTPERYIEAIKACDTAGMEVIIIDSASHEWDGKGGCLEIYESIGGKYQDWAKVTPRHRKFLEAILSSSAHVITTTRRKQDYEMSKDSSGKVKVEKMGLKEVQREGFEYELTLNFEIDVRHNATASKDRTGLFVDQPEFIISKETGEKLKAWADSGADPKEIAAKEAAALAEKEAEQKILAIKNRIMALVKELGLVIDPALTPAEKKQAVTDFIKKTTNDVLNDDLANLEIIRDHLSIVLSDRKDGGAPAAPAPEEAVL